MELHPRTTTELANLLRDHDITATLQRVEIARTMLAKKQHVSAEQVMNKVNKGRYIVSKATVYNTLRLFANRGLIKEVIVDPSKVFYEPASTNHHHIFNIDTGELIDFEADLPQIQTIPEVPQGYNVVGIDVTVRVRAGAA
ncbi:MAG: transcriptional repressor [Nitrospinota bacterium]|nr:transcriptional repressor [Nitrospinota bacterium]MDH5756727.1 transcriptional repressor [Nitrospinota bacterium]